MMARLARCSCGETRPSSSERETLFGFTDKSVEAPLALARKKGLTMLTTESAHRKDLTTGLSEMQHRHFATIAVIIREAQLPERDLWAREFADKLSRTNHNFNRDRFLRACRPQ